MQTRQEIFFFHTSIHSRLKSHSKYRVTKWGDTQESRLQNYFSQKHHAWLVAQVLRQACLIVRTKGSTRRWAITTKWPFFFFLSQAVIEKDSGKLFNFWLYFSWDTLSLFFLFFFFLKYISPLESLNTLSPIFFCWCKETNFSFFC